jgi:hypothetical protein
MAEKLENFVVKQTRLRKLCGTCEEILQSKYMADIVYQDASQLYQRLKIRENRTDLEPTLSWLITYSANLCADVACPRKVYRAT